MGKYANEQLCMCPPGTDRLVARNMRSTCSACGKDDAYGNVARLNHPEGLPPSQRKSATGTVTVTHITIVRQQGVDVVYLHTTLPHALGVTQGEQTIPYGPTLKFDCADGTGPAYCKANFPGVFVEYLTGLYPSY